VCTLSSAMNIWIVFKNVVENGDKNMDMEKWM
jgi:hypothetical protein